MYLEIKCINVLKKLFRDSIRSFEILDPVKTIFIDSKVLKVC